MEIRLHDDFHATLTGSLGYMDTKSPGGCSDILSENNSLMQWKCQMQAYAQTRDLEGFETVGTYFGHFAGIA